MLYIAGKIFHSGVRFAVVYNELAHENMTNLNIEMEMELHKTALCHHTHYTYT